MARLSAYALDVLRDLRHREAAAGRDVSDWLAYLNVANKAPRTLDAYERTVALLLNAFPEKRFDEFTDGDLLQILARIPKKSRHQHKSHFSSFFGWGYRTARRIPTNPVELLPEIRYAPSRAYDIFSDAEIEALCGLPSPDGALMEVLLWAGLRRAEARSLTVKRLDFNRREIIVIEGAKRSKDREVPMLQRVQKALSELVLLEGLGRDDHLWYSRPGYSGFAHRRPRPRRSQPISDTSFQTWWQKHLAAASVRYRKPHMTRHTYATVLRRMGVPLDDLQAFLGHSSIETTSTTYVHANDHERRERLYELMGEV